ncbi:MAG: T9SS type A sorting domain-containing protein [Bacteroidales bacterium]|nr:T9SS type A sorting domain-containing protein [Bacteroidales bacterium]MDD2322395.1 T9SS type A sorting domain-containing protein [Bacteroidales bacterium]MDD3009698.1 T9SS type A sorting domain-containing protein [Bacteroidales bacterium]MDD3960795.1 T9SS type A sorting domain-containing protein [Bacteroidales bacterium]MDY0285234.1 T9SS type A sorting domain-containing protein [Bacteroidales bacterium]
MKKIDTLRLSLPIAVKTFFLAVLIVSDFSVSGQTLPEFDWSINYPGIYTDLTRQLISTRDGGYIMVGESESFGPGIISTLLKKCDSTGNEEWSKSYGGSAFDLPTAVIETSDNGYLIATYTTSFLPEGTNIRLIKTDVIGDTVWTRVIPESNGCIVAFAGCVVETNDNGYLVAGSGWKAPNCNQIMLFKVTQAGEPEWHREIGGNSDDYGGCLQTTIDGNFILAGHTFSFGSGLCDGFLVKFDQNGEVLWSNAIGSTNYDSFRFVRQTSDGGYIAVGSTQSFGKAEQGFVVKTDSSGQTEWTAAHGGVGNEGFEGVIETSVLDYIITGSTNSYGIGLHDFFIVRIDQNGELTDMETHGGEDEDFGSTIEWIPGKGYIAGGSYSGDQYLDFWALYFNCDSLSTPVNQFPMTASSPVIFEAITPNPFFDKTTISFKIRENSNTSLSVYSLNGILLDEKAYGYLQSGKYTFEYSNDQLKPGTYLCKITSGKYWTAQRIIKGN